MPPQVIPASLEWISSYGYFVILLVMLLEGPIITVLAAFAASLGYLNIIIVYMLSFFGDWITDVFYYALGYWGRKKIIERYGYKVGITEGWLERIETVLKRHSAKSLAIIKLMPVIPTVGLIVAGAIRMPFKKFLITITAVILGTSTTYTVIGYFFGSAYQNILHTLNNGVLAFILLLIAGVFIYHLYKMMRTKLIEQFKKQELDAKK
ncbi:MAG: DedA family protein [Patescibacteria group bacterium]